MSQALVLLFLGSSAARAALAPDLEAWARARWFTLSDPPATSAGAPRYDAKLVTRLESGLERARILAGSRDDSGALAELARVEKELRAHPSLPQSAWLMAERWVLEAEVREHDEAGSGLAATLRRRAELLEGPRATNPPDSDQPPRAELAALPARHEVEVLGLEPGDELSWDGVRSGWSLKTRPGEHHALVSRRGTPAWGGWVQVSAGGKSVRLDAPATPACSLADIGDTRVEGGRVKANPAVRCARWAVAKRRNAGGILVATCNFARCGPLLPWQRSDGSVYDGPPQPAPAPGFPVWGRWAIGSAVVLTVTGIVLWRAGVFDREAAPPPAWTYTGPGQGAQFRF